MATSHFIDRESDLSSSGNYLSGDFNQDDIQRHMEELDERLSCAVCLMRFTEPRMLECNHSFCKHCLEDILKKRVIDLDHPLGEDEIACPRCRKITRLGGGKIETLPRNFDLEAVAGVLPPEQDLATPVKSKVFPRQPSMPACSDHNKELAYYCKTDQKLVCADCLVETAHRHHDTDHANTVGDTERKLFQEGCFELLENERLKFTQALHEVSHATKSLKMRGEQTKEHIQEHFEIIRDSLVRREQELLRETENIISTKVAALVEQEKQLGEVHEELDAEFQYSDKMMKSSPIAFLYAKEKLEAKAKEVIKRAQKIDRTPVEVFSQGPYWHHPSTNLTDTETTSGVFCDPAPSMYTVSGAGLKKAFVGKEATFKVEARDKYGNRSFMKGTSPGVTIFGPNKSYEISCIVDEMVAGEYVIRYNPSEVGWHAITITVNEESIQNGKHQVIVFKSKDYLGLSRPVKRFEKSQLNCEPPIATMRGLCTLANGWIIFTDAFFVRVIDGTTGKVRQTLGSFGNAPGQFNTPLGVTVTPQNHIFVTDTSNHRVQRFSLEPSGRFKFQSMFGAQGTNKQSLQYPEGIAALGDDRVFIVDKGNNRIQVISQKNMKHTSTIGKKGQKAGHFNDPRDVTIDPNLVFLLVSDSGNKRIQALTFEGKPFMMFGTHNLVRFNDPPSFIAVDTDGFILVANTRNTTYQIVTVLTPTGEFIHQIGYQDGVCYFKTPCGICVDGQGMVIITDSTNSRMLCF